MSNLNFEKYEELQKIEDTLFITTMQNIKKDISDPCSPIPNRAISINLLRSMCKFHVAYFFNFFWGIKNDFIKNCLYYEDSPKLQQISIMFLSETMNNIYNEIPHENVNEFILLVLEKIIIFLEKNNSNLKSYAGNFIKNMAETIPCEAVPISLIKSLEEKDENIINFIYNCIESYFKEYISYGLNFDFIIESLEISEIINNEECKDYYAKIKKVFDLLKNIIETQGNNINQFIHELHNKNKEIFIELIK